MDKLVPFSTLIYFYIHPRFQKETHKCQREEKEKFWNSGNKYGWKDVEAMFSTNHQHNNSPHPQVQPAYSAAMCSVLTPSYLLPSFYLPLPPSPLPSYHPLPLPPGSTLHLSFFPSPLFPRRTFLALKWRCHSVSHRSRQILTHSAPNTHLVMMITMQNCWLFVWLNSLFWQHKHLVELIQSFELTWFTLDLSSNSFLS